MVGGEQGRGEMLGSDCRLARVRHRELTASHPEITADTEKVFL